MKNGLFTIGLLLTLLFGCQQSVDPLAASKVVPTQEQLINAIIQTDQWTELKKTELAINEKLPDIIHNASPSFIAKYREVRDKYQSLSELATSSNNEDRSKFISLWNELHTPILTLIDYREKQFSALYAVMNLEYTVTKQDLSLALSQLHNPKSSSSNARRNDCEGQAKMNRDIALNFCLTWGYGYSFSSEIAMDVYFDTLDNCNGSGEAWC